MKRTPIDQRELPDYTRGEEIMNMVTHIVGGGIGVLVLIAGVILSALKRDAWGIVSAAIYGLTMIWLYTMSSVYHGLRPSRAKKVLQVLDHCTIYALIVAPIRPSCWRASGPCTRSSPGSSSASNGRCWPWPPR